MLLCQASVKWPNIKFKKYEKTQKLLLIKKLSIPVPMFLMKNLTSLLNYLEYNFHYVLFYVQIYYIVTTYCLEIWYEDFA